MKSIFWIKNEIKKIEQKMTFHDSISQGCRVFCWFENTILVRKNKIWHPNIKNIQNFWFFFKKIHNLNTKRCHTLDEKNVKNERFSKIIISSFTLRFSKKMEFYSKIIGGTLSIFFIFFIILTVNGLYQGINKLGKNQKKLLHFFEKKW